MKTRTVLTRYNVFQAHREAAELHVPHIPGNKEKSSWESKKVVGKRGALLDVLKGTSEEVKSLKPQKFKKSGRTLTELTPKNRGIQ